MAGARKRGAAAAAAARTLSVAAALAQLGGAGAGTLSGSRCYKDVVFIIDDSTSVIDPEFCGAREHFDLLKGFAAQTVTEVNIGTERRGHAPSSVRVVVGPAEPCAHARFC